MRPLTFEEVQSRSILNTHKHVDDWFWDKYSANPYIGCRYGCTFCFSRGGPYASHQDAAHFDERIKVKINAPALLEKALPNRPVDVIALGDWQTPAERKYQLSRQMLAVALKYRFPVFIVERSPLLLRDLDLLIELAQAAWVAVAFSISSLDHHIKHTFEPFSPGVRQRFNAMQELARAGILTGATLMPILPFVSDTPEAIEKVIAATKEHGGQFVLGGGLSMQGEQARLTLQAYQKWNPALEKNLRKYYQWTKDGQPQYSPPESEMRKLGRIVRALCHQYHLKDRIPRFIPTGPLGKNKKVAEMLFNQAYQYTLEGQPAYRIWAYRKAAWRLDELDTPIQQIYNQKGQKGLTALPDIGAKIAHKILDFLM